MRRVGVVVIGLHHLRDPKVPGSIPGSDTMSTRVIVAKLLTHSVSLPQFDVHSSTYGEVSQNGIHHCFT